MRKRILLIHFGIFGLIVLLVHVGCPIFRITGILCPTCGVSRGWLALLQGDVGRAFQYHALFPLIPLFLFALGHRSSFLKRWQRSVDIFLYGVAGLLVVYNILRWIGVVIKP